MKRRAAVQTFTPGTAECDSTIPPETAIAASCAQQ